MAQVLLADDIDFGAYLLDTETRAKVKPASVFVEDLEAEFAFHDRPREPTMFSTKLDGRIHFRPGEVTVWAGYNGHRKSTLTGQAVIDLCVQKQRVMVASLEMKPAKTLARMARQASGSHRPTAEVLRKFSAWTDGRLWILDHLGELTTEKMLAACNYFADQLSGSHVVIDSLMMICRSEERLDEQKQFITTLVRLAQELGIHVHLVAHCRKPSNKDESRPTKYDIRGSASLSDQAANVITVWANKAKAEALAKNPHDTVAGAEPDAVVSVEKQRNGEWEGAVKLWFDQASMRFVNDRTTPVVPYEFLVRSETDNVAEMTRRPYAD